MVEKKSADANGSILPKWCGVDGYIKRVIASLLSKSKCKSPLALLHKCVKQAIYQK